jgi:hypothetical protein
VCLDPESLKRLSARATAVRLREGESQTVSLTVQAGWRN